MDSLILSLGSLGGTLTSLPIRKRLRKSLLALARRILISTLLTKLKNRRRRPGRRKLKKGRGSRSKSKLRRMPKKSRILSHSLIRKLKPQLKRRPSKRKRAMKNQLPLAMEDVQPSTSGLRLYK